MPPPLSPARHTRYQLSSAFQLLIIFLQLHLCSEISPVGVGRGLFLPETRIETVIAELRSSPVLCCSSRGRVCVYHEGTGNPSNALPFFWGVVVISTGYRYVILDIPLLFETSGLTRFMKYTVLVYW